MSTISEYLEDMIETCGGFGRYQFILAFALFCSKISVNWTMLLMTFGGVAPDWWCLDDSQYGSNNYTGAFKECSPINTSQCSHFRYDDSLVTVVSKWDLVCDKEWISSTITTIQMAGVLAGGLICGQMGDYFGRKPTLFSAVVLVMVTNIAAMFSVSWQMFAVFRFFMGISSGMILTVYIVLMYEFISVQKRAVVSGLPSWVAFAAMFALVAWLVHDWKYLHAATAAIAFPILLTWWFIPESFRWLVVHRRFDEARETILKMARINGVPEPDVSGLEKLEVESDSVYTVLDLFKGKFLLKNTLLHAFMWISCGYVYYAISFNVEKLSGNLYLNMFLLSMVDAPANAFTIFLNNKIGRKWTALGFFVICFLASLGVALVQALNVGSISGQLVNAFAMVTKLTCSAAWVAVGLLSTEIYPTVIRNLGYGFHNTAARIGAMIAPQMVFLNDKYPGIMYFLCSGMMITSAVFAFLSAETKGRKLQDTIEKNPEKLKQTIFVTESDYQKTKL